MENLQYVGFWDRFWASVIDMIVFMMIIYPIFYMIYGASFMQKASDFTLVNNLVNYLLPFIAVIILWKSKGATPGKMFIKATIVDEKSLGEPSTKQLVVRYFAYILSAIPLFLGYFWAGWDKKKQTWHDKLAHTVVIQPKKEKKSKGTGSYLAIGVGAFAIGAFGILLTLGVMLQSGMMPDGDLYDLKKLPPKVLTSLKQKYILREDEVLEYYQSESIFSFTNSGVLVTDKAIRYFETNDKEEVLEWNFPFKDIVKLTLDVQEYALGIEIVTMTIYNEEGEADFIIGLTPKKNRGKAFKIDLMKRWDDARK
jgi:uncharacterized RDD family membrane protein YckC